MLIYNKIYAESNKEYFKEKSKERYNSAENSTRYKKYKEDYLRRKNLSITSIRGRLYSLLYAAKTRAKKKKLGMELNLDWLIQLYDKQNGKCAVTGLDFTLDINIDGIKNYMPYSPSLDRIDSSKGYTKENTRIVCTIVNLALNNFGDKHFDIMCKAYIHNLS